MPLLVLVFWMFTAFPLLTGITLSPFLSGVAALTLNLTAYISEIYRAGISSISQGQTHAALALGMTRLQLLRRIVLPQALGASHPGPWQHVGQPVQGHRDPLGDRRRRNSCTKAGSSPRTPTARSRCSPRSRVIYYILAYPQALGVNYLYRKFQVHE